MLHLPHLMRNCLKINTTHCSWFFPGALGNGLKQLELSKAGLIAHPMQNSVRNMIGTLVLMCGGLIMSKLRILDGLWKGDFNLVGIPVWREI